MKSLIEAARERADELTRIRRDLHAYLVNDAEITRIAAHAARDVVGPAAIRGDVRTMGGEDMAFIHQHVPGCFVFVGSGYTDGREVFPHHHASFDIDEGSLPIGTAVLASAALAVLAAIGSLAKPPRT